MEAQGLFLRALCDKVTQAVQGDEHAGGFQVISGVDGKVISDLVYCLTWRKRNQSEGLPPDADVVGLGYGIAEAIITFAQNPAEADDLMFRLIARLLERLKVSIREMREN
ncbi:MAG: hypothetical protein WD850_03540 [Candidatus Spechtbacterales bacterium]